MADFSTAIKKLEDSRVISSINWEKITVEYNFISCGRTKMAFKNEDKIRSFSANGKLRKLTTSRTWLEENVVNIL